MSNSSRRLTQNDRQILNGFYDIRRPEPKQLDHPEFLAEPEKKKTPQESLQPIRERALKQIERIEEVKKKVDQRCDHLATTFSEKDNSPLFQAMWRVFKKETDTITYADYKATLELREQLATEDRQNEEIKDRMQQRGVYGS